MDDVLIRFRLVGDEAQALLRLSANEMRRPTHQVRFMLRRELERRGLLHINGDVQTPAPEQDLQMDEETTTELSDATDR